jgi:hydroxyacylglutathione hydrolase
MTTIIPIPAFRDNYIWTLRNAGHAAVVDPGDAAPVLAWLDANGVQLSAIIATHHHADHVGGVEALRARYDVPVFGPARESIPRRTQGLVEGDRIDVPGVDVSLGIYDIPGHTAGHIACYASGDDPMLFCGDTLFAAGCGRIFEGTPAQMWSSLSKLAALPAATRVYCGHEYTLANLQFAQAVEPDNREVRARMAREAAKRERGEPTLPSTIGAELGTNPFLRAALPEVMARAAQHAGRRITDAIDSFAILREWKNGFRG